ncbi:MAG TPA: hypothetical protein VH062_33075 [Polyangiaceae bacterium]|jgi:uncharacterized delta-60 repeat protein|nr:hypothetical protein [Polyangiaceae bacterium]
MRPYTIAKSAFLTSLLPVTMILACSSDSASSGGPDGGGATTSTGGKSSDGSGGKSATGGKAGATSTGGTAPSSGGGTGGETNPADASTGGGGDTDSGTGGADTDGGDAGEPGPGLTPLVNALSTTGPDRFYGVTTDAKGNVYAVGQIADSTDTTADFSVLVAKFTALGVLDTTFGTKGFVTRNVVTGTNGELYRGIVVQSTGKIVVSGQAEHAGAADVRDRDMVVLRFNPDGTKDTTFGTDGVLTLDLSTGALNGTAFSADSAWGLVAYADDRLVVSGGKVRSGGVDTDFVLVRLSKDGVLDDAFGDHGVFELDTMQNGMSNNASPRNVTLLPGTDGIIGAGYQPIPGADTGPVVYKVTDAGKLDTTFGTDGVFSDRPLTEQTETYMAAVQPAASGTGYSLVTTGYGRQLDTETTDIVSLRLTSAGKLDTTYGTAGVARIDIGGFGDNSRRLAVLPDRSVLLVGGGRLTSADVDGTFVKLTADGQPDTTFAPKGFRTVDLGGPADFLWSVALTPDKKFAVAAGISGVGATPTPATLNDDTTLVLLPLTQ